MIEPKPFASLTSGLLARKGGARPAMRRTYVPGSHAQPNLPLSVVVHIDYRKAPLVIQRFGNVAQLVEQTLDPMVSSYFKNISQTKTFIELIQSRSELQTKVPSARLSGLRLISTGNSVPSLRTAESSMPVPIGRTELLAWYWPRRCPACCPAI